MNTKVTDAISQVKKQNDVIKAYTDTFTQMSSDQLLQTSSIKQLTADLDGSKKIADQLKANYQTALDTQ